MFLNKKIDYYGKRNSICDITKLEEENTYVVRRYDNNGKVKNELFYVPCKNKNLLALRDEYYSDVSEYLRKNKTKYEDYKNTKGLFFKDINDKKMLFLKRLTKIGIILGASAVGLSFYLASFGLVLYISTGVLAVSSVSNVILKDLSKGIEIKKYLDRYEMHQRDLIEYEAGIGIERKREPTKYEELNHEHDGKIIDFNYKRVKSKVA